jgi:ADP-ribosyl-[dinitrogen reductase] hydrolase
MLLADRIRGCLLFGALGDALGSSVEGMILANSPRQIGPITDDTQLTLATCNAIVNTGGVSPEHIAATYANWHLHRKFRGLGSSTLKALTDLSVGQHWALTGAKGERAAGNGAAMRIAPLAFCLNPDANEDRRTIRDICRITHHHDEAYIGALAIVMAIRGVAYDSAPLTELLAHVANQIPDSQVRDRLREIMDAQPQSIAAAAAQFGNSGFVADSVPFALFAASRCEEHSPEALLQQIIATGGDTDTNASLAGQILGAALGYSALPQQLISQLNLDAELVAIVDQFVDFCSRSEN